MVTEMQDLTRGSLWKKILSFSLPLVLSNVLQVLFNMSDVAVVGRFAGANALGSVGSTTTLVALYTGFLMGIGSGINVIAARFFGGRGHRDLQETVHTAFLVSLIIGCSVLLLGEIVLRPVLLILHTKEELLDGASLYLRIYLSGMPAMAIYNFGNAVFSAVGDTKKPLLFLSFAGVVNVTLNLFFVIVCKLSVAGVAIASVASQYLSAILVLAALIQAPAPYCLCREHLTMTGEKARLILRLGLPAGLQNAIFQIANLFIQFGVNSFSATVVSGNAAAANADALVYDVMAAFYTACGSFIGQNLGAGKLDRVRKSYQISLVYSFGIGAILGLTLVCFGRQFLSLFAKEPAVIDAGMYRLTIMGCSYAVSAFMDCSIAASRGLGMSLVPTIIVLVGACLFRILWIFTVFAWFRTLTSLYLLYICSWTLTAAAEIFYFRKMYGKCVEQYRSLQDA